MSDPQPNPQNMTLQWALFYYDYGWSVIPGHTQTNGVCSCKEGVNCVSPGKHPAIPWTRYQSVRADRAVVQRWFEGPFAGFNVGIVTGPASGNLFIVDVDEGPGKDGGETIHDLQMKYDDFPDTMQAITGGGGRHYLFTAPPGFVVKTDRNILGSGVDTRGSGGYFVVAPSLHQSGNRYLWDENYHPQRIGPALAPDWLLNLVGNTGHMSMAVSNNKNSTPPNAAGEINAFGMVQDGRERYMIRVICGCIGSYVRQHGALPEPGELFDMAWPTYSKNTKIRGASLEADGRGETLMRQRIRYQLHRAETGKFPIFQQIADELANEAVRAGIEGEEIPAPEPEPDNPDEYPLPMTWLRDVEANIDAADFVEDLLCEGQMSIVYGESGCGKTFFMTDLAFHVATGRPWRDRAVEKGGVIYVALEGGFGIANRLSALKAHHRIDPAEPIPFGVVPCAINLLDPAADTGKLIKLVKMAAAEIGEPIKLVVIDTLSRALFGGNENDSKDMGALVINADRIRQAAGSHVSFVHHSGKNRDLGARGHSLLRAATDTEIEVSREEGATFSVAKVTKQREIESDGKFGFQLKTIDLGKNRRGKPVTSCVVEPVGAEYMVRKPALPALKAEEQYVMSKIMDVFAAPATESLVVMTTPLTNMPVQRCLSGEVLLRELVRIGYHRTDDQHIKMLEALEMKRRIGQSANWVWLLKSE
jgi:hypothetical protein